MLKQYRLRDYRFRLVCYVFAITIIGILVIGSAEKSVQDQQILGLFLGTAAMIVISLIDYNWVLKFRWLIYGFNLLLLVLVIATPLGYENNGATRWLRLGGFQFQPSELCKLCLILFFAKFLDRYKEMLNTWKILILSVLLFGLPAALVEQQPDLSTTISLCVIFLILIFIAGLSWKIIGGALAGLAGAFFSLVELGAYSDSMVNGRGFIASALVIFGRWDPLWTLGGGLLFGGIDALQNRLQVLGSPIPSNFLQMTPYVVTILALLIGRRRKAPAAMGIPYVRK